MIWRGPVLPVALILIAISWVGCLRTPPLLISTTGEPLPIDDERAQRLLTTYLEMADDRPGLRGSARVALSGPDFKLNRPQRIVVERPARLRFEILGLFDQLAALLVTDGRRFGFFDAATGEMSRGIASSSLLWDLARIDLAPDEAVGLLLGAPRPSPGLARAGIWLEPEGRIALAFAWPSEGRIAELPETCQTEPESGLFDPDCFLDEGALRQGGEVFFFERDGNLVELRSLDPDGVIRFRVLFEQYEQLDGSDGVIFPMRVTVRSPAVASEARFVWKRVMLARDLSDRLFTLPVRRNAGQGD